MISNEIKMRVGETCPEYTAKNYIATVSMGPLGVSCVNCNNYIKENCTKELFNHIYEIIKLN